MPDASPLQYLFSEPPALGTVTEVAPGVRWLRMGLPFALDHVNLWLLEDGDGWAIVDCGIDDAHTRAAWEQVFEGALQGRPVRRVIATHMHPDHIGLAHWLTERWNCRLWVSATDYHTARTAIQARGGFGGDAAADFFAAHGIVDEGWLAKVRSRPNEFARLVPALPPRFHRLMDGQTLELAGQRWRAIAGYGHSPEHIALHCPAMNLLIAGDMVLPRISTNVSVTDIEPEGDPLPMYLDSLQRMRHELPADTRVLPSHGLPFVGLHARIEQLTSHHEARLHDAMAACAEAPRSAADLLPVLFRRRLDAQQTPFAMGESLAHLHALWHQGRLVRRRDDDGVWRFAPA